MEAESENQPKSLTLDGISADTAVGDKSSGNSAEAIEPVSGGASAEKKAPKNALPEELLDAPLVHGGLWKAIWLMSWPLLISTVSTSIVGMVDVQVSGYLGPSSQAAVGLSEHITFLFMIVIFSISVGTTAIVSREFGEGNTEETLRGTSQSIVLSAICGVILALMALTCSKFFLPLFTNSAEVMQLGGTYLSLFGLYLIPFSIVCIICASFRAIGDAKTPLFIVIFDVVVNIIGDYLTVLKGWPVPGLGIRGIAISGVVANSVAAVVAICMLYRSPLKDCIKRLTKFDWEMQKRILKIGLPSAIQRAGWAGSVFAVFFILARVDGATAALASWTIGMRVEGLLFMPMIAFSLAVSSIIGQNLGAGKIDRAFKAGWNVTFLATGLMLVFGSIMFIFADPIAAFMSQDPETIKFTASYLRINAVAEPLLAVAMVLMGALQGAGDTKVPMLISVFSNWVIRLPLAWWLAITLKMGPDGVWLSMALSVCVSAVLCIIRFKSGQWTKIKV